MTSLHVESSYLEMQPGSVKVSTCFVNGLFVMVTTCLMRFISVMVCKPITFDTMYSTLKSTRVYRFLRSQRRVIFPIGLMCCPPNATSLARDFLSGFWLIRR